MPEIFSSFRNVLDVAMVVADKYRSWRMTLPIDFEISDLPPPETQFKVVTEERAMGARADKPPGGPARLLLHPHAKAVRKHVGGVGAERKPLLPAGGRPLNGAIHRLR